MDKIYKLREKIRESFLPKKVEVYIINANNDEPYNDNYICSYLEIINVNIYIEEYE